MDGFRVFVIREHDAAGHDVVGDLVMSPRPNIATKAATVKMGKKNYGQPHDRKQQKNANLCRPELRRSRSPFNKTSSCSLNRGSCKAGHSCSRSRRRPTGEGYRIVEARVRRNELRKVAFHSGRTTEIGRQTGDHGPASLAITHWSIARGLLESRKPALHFTAMSYFIPFRAYAKRFRRFSRLHTGWLVKPSWRCAHLFGADGDCTKVKGFHAPGLTTPAGLPAVSSGRQPGVTLQCHYEDLRMPDWQRCARDRSSSLQSAVSSTANFILYRLRSPADGVSNIGVDERMAHLGVVSSPVSDRVGIEESACSTGGGRSNKYG